MLITDALNKKPPTNPANIIACKHNDPVREGISRLNRHKIGAVVILRDNHVAGIFTERDVVVGISRQGPDFLNAQLADVMVSKVIIVPPTQTVDGALTLMLKHKIRHLPVVDGDTLVGILSMRDLAVQQLDLAEQTVEFLKNQVHLGSSPLPM